MLEIIKTDDGYMVQKDGEDYICDANGDNLWDTYAEAEAVFYGVSQTSPSQSIRDAVGENIFAQTNWAKANAAFYEWERDYGEESDLSDDDRMIWVEGYLQALRDASKQPCLYCGGNCPNDEDHACDGYLGDIDGLYSEDAK
jgi:hypothetical protein